MVTRAIVLALTAAVAFVALRRFRDDVRAVEAMLVDDIDWLSEMRPSVAYAGRN